MSWGCQWGSLQWGGKCVLPFEEGYHVRVKPDTRLSIRWDVTDSVTFTDQSQWGADLDTTGSVGFVDVVWGGARWDMREQRTVSARVYADATGSVARWGDPSDPTERGWELVLARADDTNAPALYAYHSGSDPVTHVTCSTAALADMDYLSVHWSCSPTWNEDSDVLECTHELWVYDHANSLYTASFAPSAYASASQPDWEFTAGWGADGSDPLVAASELPLRRLRVDDAYHTSIEFSEDYVSASAYRAWTSPRESPRLWYGGDSALGGDGEFFGPVVQQAASTGRDDRYRATSPLINRAWPLRRYSTFNPGSDTHDVVENTYSGTLWRTPPGVASGDGWWIYTNWLWHVDLPPHLPGRARVFWRAHVGVDNTARLPGTRDVSVRLYSSNDIPGLSAKGNINIDPNEKQPPTISYYDQVVRTIPNDSVAEVWVSGTLKVSPHKGPGDLEGSTFFFLAVSGAEGVSVGFDSLYVLGMEGAPQGGLPQDLGLGG